MAGWLNATAPWDQFDTAQLGCRSTALQGENVDGLTYKPGRRQPEAGARGTDGGPGQGSGGPAAQELGPLSIGGWAHEYGKGRVAFTSIGHTVDTLSQPEYFKIQKNAVRWLLRLQQ